MGLTEAREGLTLAKGGTISGKGAGLTVAKGGTNSGKEGTWGLTVEIGKEILKTHLFFNLKRVGLTVAKDETNSCKE